MRPPPPRLTALDDDGAEPFLLLDAFLCEFDAARIVMHSSNQCHVSFAVDLCANDPVSIERSETTEPSSWRHVDGVEAVIQQWWRRAANTF